MISSEDEKVKATLRRLEGRREMLSDKYFRERMEKREITKRIKVLTNNYPELLF